MILIMLLLSLIIPIKEQLLYLTTVIRIKEKLYFGSIDLLRKNNIHKPNILSNYKQSIRLIINKVFLKKHY